ncbi:MAG: dihydroxyacetone kinase subunit DhaK [Deltaproteobacteria bacterium]|nr:dihydroxyacetone kinase subunit DhaK [Deltaproteobacteria bacterium]
MKKFINRPENLTMEMLEGLSLAFPELLELKGESGKLVVNRKLNQANRVTVVSIGGTGHEPALSGLVGEGMLDISVPGDVFAAPGPKDVIEALKLADQGQGVLFIVLNHAGDMLTAKMVMKTVEKEGLHVKQVTTQEDIANAPRSNSDDRRGLVGCVPLYHIAGAAAAAGKSLEEVRSIAQRFADSMATVAVACKGATHPATGMEISVYNDTEMEIGAGQHGEGGGGKMPMKTADETADIMLNLLVQDLGIKPGERLMLIVNGSGATTIMEQSIVFRRAYKLLKEKGIEVAAGYVGELLTVQEAAGFQMFIARMDDELIELWNKPCKTPYFNK